MEGESQVSLRARGWSRCGMCHETKPLSEFYTSKKPTGVMRVDPNCKVCARAKQSKYYRDKRAAKKKADEEWEKRNGNSW